MEQKKNKNSKNITNSLDWTNATQQTDYTMNHPTSMLYTMDTLRTTVCSVSLDSENNNIKYIVYDKTNASFCFNKRKEENIEKRQTSWIGQRESNRDGEIESEVKE